MTASSPTARPSASDGARACVAASADAVERGAVGAGTGAVAGGLKGGVGSASQVLPCGTTVAALVVLNAVGSVLDPATGRLWGEPHLLPGDDVPPAPDPAALQAFLASRDLAPAPSAGQATTLVVVATDLTLTKAACSKVASVSHDGLARAVDPVHTMMDGDTAFALATGDRPAPDLAAMHALLGAAGQVTTRAVVDAVLSAHGVRTAAGSWPGYRDLLVDGAG